MKVWIIVEVMIDVEEDRFQIYLGDKSWESLGLQGDQSWVFFGRNDAKAETPVLWPLHAKTWLIGKDFDAKRYWGQEKWTTEDEMAGWHHWLDGCESEWTPGVGDGQGGLVCCDSWGRKESDTTERLIWSDLIIVFSFYYFLFLFFLFYFIFKLYIIVLVLPNIKMNPPHV